MNDIDHRAYRLILAIAIVYGVLHAVVDGACAALLAHHRTGGSLSGDQIWTLFLIYNGLAFALQVPLGAMADFRRYYRTAMLVGAGLGWPGHGSLDCVGPRGPLAWSRSATLPFISAAGATVLRISPERAGPAGLFVAPGSLGLVAGTWCGENLVWWPWLCLGLLALCGMVVLAIHPAAERRVRSFSGKLHRGRSIVMTAVGLLLVSVAVRSTVGMTIGAVHEGQATVLLGLAWAAFFGKALGGLLGGPIRVDQNQRSCPGCVGTAVGDQHFERIGGSLRACSYFR